MVLLLFIVTVHDKEIESFFVWVLRHEIGEKTTKNDSYNEFVP